MPRTSRTLADAEAGRTDRGVLSLPERMMVRALRVPEGDYRDWDAIRGWAKAIAAELSTG
jgi:menaquinone-dependent protoporphyrinogen oxidase